jgi:thiol-disulfide isomerase/thioredoxin
MDFQFQLQAVFNLNAADKNYKFIIMKNVFLFFSALLVIVFSSCDKIDEPYGQVVPTTAVNDTEIVMRKVFIEDFTGQTCGNCPRAAEVLEQISQLRGDKIVSMALHVGFFAEPSGSYYSNDYRTTIGNEIEQNFGNEIAGLPNGLVNRKSFDGITILSKDAWEAKSSELLDLPPEAFMWITPTYSATDRSLNVSVRTKVLQGIDEGLNIILYLTEDSIVSAQKDYSLPSPSLIQSYTHRHMLRAGMNGAWGETLSAQTTYAVGEELITTASYTIPATWNANHVSVVALLTRTASKEVVQAEDKEIN